MYIKVDNDELSYFVKNMNTDSESLRIEIENMINLVNRLGSEVWQGADATTFQNNVTEYLEKMKVIPKAITTLANITEKKNNGYVENDQAFAKALEEVANKYAK